MANFQKITNYIEQFIFIIAFPQALEWTYQKIIIMKDKLIRLLSKRNKQERKSCELCTNDWWYQKELNNYDKKKPAVEMHRSWWGSFCLN